MVDSFYIPAAVQNVWNAWNIRGFMILSLVVQLILTVTAPLRKKTTNGFTIFVIWSAYFISDWAAVFALGLITNAGCKSSNDKTEVAQNVMAFWAAFLLIHLGGPDTITAFSLEDNALWLRHLVGLIAQVFAFLYIFAKTLPDNKLVVPTILIFVSGVIKYGERTRALYLASLENMKKSIKKTRGGHMDDGEDNFSEHIRPAFHFHNIFKGLMVDITPDLSEWNESREFILKKNYYDALKLISMELSFMYEFLYTKIMAANSGLGVLIRIIAYFSALAGLILFCLANKDEFHVVDVVITYALLGGVFALDMASLVMVMRSDWSSGNNWYLALQVMGHGCFPLILVLAFVWHFLQDTAIGDFMDRYWSEKLGSFNLLSLCFKQSRLITFRKPGFIWERLAEMKHTSKEFFYSDLWRVVFEDVNRKAIDAVDAERMRLVYEARGDRAIKETGCPELLCYIDGRQYDNTILVWHVATEICYNLEKDFDRSNDQIRFTKILSDYMMYLLVKQPKLMSAVAGIGHIRYDHTCLEAKLLGTKLRGMKFRASIMPEFCALILEEHTDISEPDIDVEHYLHSVLNDACGLVRLLRENNDRWEIMFKVWMEMLEYAAGHCKADSHARLLSEGGEFITFVWMLMAHYGIGAQFPIE